ncbi:MAG TPA: carbohydrate ABC transporter permease, partial [Gammaproteobacteria bacterium]|nr:carbohydrate ABC transporter permease [Gammaproteobacteria bacterium]
MNPINLFLEKFQKEKGTAAFYILALITVFVSFFPIIWLLFTSLMPAKDIYSWPPLYYPSPPTLTNYIKIIESSPELLLYIWNSIVVASITTLIILLSGGLAAYALTRFKFKGQKA